MDYYKDNDPITAFWQWFYKNHALIKEVLDAEDTHPAKYDIVNALDNHVLGFGRFKWEIGYGTQGGYSLFISPNGDEDLLRKSQEIMDVAPNLPDWEFYPAKPAKDWDLKFSIYDEQMFIHQIDASDWRFVLIPQKNGKEVVVLEAPNISHLDLGVQTNAGNLVLVNMIGEERKILHVAGILIVKALSTQHQAECHPIKKMNEVFDL